MPRALPPVEPCPFASTRAPATAPPGPGAPTDGPTIRRLAQAALLVLAGLAAGPSARAQEGLSLPGQVEGQVKIGQFQGGFFGGIDPLDLFAHAVAAPGDIDGDGVDDLAVGVPHHDGGGAWRGAVWILFLEPDGTVRSWQRLTDQEGDLPEPPQDYDRFGYSLAPLGDLDGDGVPDLAVGATGQDDGGLDRGAVHLLLLRPDGTVREQRVISATRGGFEGPLDDFDAFGTSVARPGDLDGDGLDDLVVGARLDDDGGSNTGACWVLFLDGDGAVRAEQKLSPTTGGLRAQLADLDLFGYALTGLGDLDGDGVPDLAVGAPNDSDGGTAHGAVYVLHMRADGTVRETTKINDLVGGLEAEFDSIDSFGTGLAGLGDLDGDGVPDLAVSAPNDDDAAPGTETQGSSRGAIYLLFLRPDGTVRDHHKISDAEPSFLGQLLGANGFGTSLASLGDRDGDGTPDLAAGCRAEPGFGGPPKGAVWSLRLHAATWRDLGGGFGPAPGTAPPSLDGVGTLLPGAPLTVRLSSRLVQAPLVLVLGPTWTGAPLGFGLLGPDPVALVPALTDSAGGLALDDRWPPGAAPGTTLLAQAWFAGSTGLVAASNTLEATAP